MLLKRWEKDRAEILSLLPRERGGCDGGGAGGGAAAAGWEGGSLAWAAAGVGSMGEAKGDVLEMRLPEEG